MVDLFADIPRETVESTLQTIRANLDRVGLYGGHAQARRHPAAGLKDAADERRYPLCHILLGQGSGRRRGKGDHEELLRPGDHHMAEVWRG